MRRLAKLQASLGHARDIATTPTLLDAIREDDQPALSLAIGAVAGWQARDQMAVAKTLRKRWRQFKATPAFWGRSVRCINWAAMSGNGSNPMGTNAKSALYEVSAKRHVRELPIVLKKSCWSANETFRAPERPACPILEMKGLTHVHGSELIASVVIVRPRFSQRRMPTLPTGDKLQSMLDQID